MRRAIFQGLVGLMAIAVPPSAAPAQLVTGPGNALGDVNGDGVRDIVTAEVPARSKRCIATRRVGRR